MCVRVCCVLSRASPARPMPMPVPMPMVPPGGQWTLTGVVLLLLCVRVLTRSVSNLARFTSPWAAWCSPLPGGHPAEGHSALQPRTPGPRTLLCVWMVRVGKTVLD